MSLSPRSPRKKTGGRKPKVTLRQMIVTLKATNGQVMTACDRLGVDKNVFYRAKKKYPVLAEVLADARERILDASETKLFKAIKKGSPWAILYHLKTHGRSRGYVEKQEHDITANVNASIKHAPLTRDELHAELLRRGLPTSLLKD